jgi:hypothetical protein
VSVVVLPMNFPMSVVAIYIALAFGWVLLLLVGIDVDGVGGKISNLFRLPAGLAWRVGHDMVSLVTEVKAGRPVQRKIATNEPHSETLKEENLSSPDSAMTHPSI